MCENSVYLVTLHYRDAGSGFGGGEAGVRARRQRAAAPARARRPVPPRLTAAHLQLYYHKAVYPQEIAVRQP